MDRLTIVRLFEEQHEKLHLNWRIARGENRPIEFRGENNFGAEMVGHLNIVHPERLQVIGQAEIDWIARTPPQRFRQLFDEILTKQPPAILVADNLPVPPAIQEACELTQTPLFTSPKTCSALIDMLRSYLARQLAEVTSMHGVLMDVLGMGVLITGDSGVGKSELALELISRGHGLVADDVVELSRIAPNVIEGRCPGMLRDFLEVRGLGLLNIRTIFGETASRRKMRLKLVVHLQRLQPGRDAPRLPLDEQTTPILEVPIRKVVIPVASGRNLAVLLEAAVRNTILTMRGIDSMQEFLRRQQQAMLAAAD